MQIHTKAFFKEIKATLVNGQEIPTFSIELRAFNDLDYSLPLLLSEAQTLVNHLSPGDIIEVTFKENERIDKVSLSNATSTTKPQKPSQINFVELVSTFPIQTSKSKELFLAHFIHVGKGAAVSAVLPEGSYLACYVVNSSTNFEGTNDTDLVRVIFKNSTLSSLLHHVNKGEKIKFTPKLFVLKTNKDIQEAVYVVEYFKNSKGDTFE